jgi:hypothetical protein
LGLLGQAHDRHKAGQQQPKAQHCLAGRGRC